MYCQKHGEVECVVYNNDTKSGCKECLAESPTMSEGTARRVVDQSDEEHLSFLAKT